MVESHAWSGTGTRSTLAARTWSDPGSPPSHLLLLAHGYGEHVGRYERVAEVLVGNGAVVYAVDHQGHGRSDGEQALVQDVEEVVTDLHTVADTARAEQPELPVVLLGHPMAGLIASRYAHR